MRPEEVEVLWRSAGPASGMYIIEDGVSFDLMSGGGGVCRSFDGCDLGLHSLGSSAHAPLDLLPRDARM